MVSFFVDSVNEQIKLCEAKRRMNNQHEKHSQLVHVHVGGTRGLSCKYSWMNNFLPYTEK